MASTHVLFEEDGAFKAGTVLADAGASLQVEAASLLFRLHGAPVYFYRKGRGRYRPAPADTLRAALAALERRR